MKTFKQLLTEMPVDNYDTTAKRLPLYKHDSYMKSHDERKELKHEGTYQVNDDYEVHHHSISYGLKYGDKHYFNVVHKPTGHMHLQLQTHVNPGWQAHRVSNLAGVEGNNLKAHELYHHLLSTGKLKALYSDHTHSTGGKKVWQRLSQMPGINMRLMKKGKEIPIHKVWQKNYGDFSSLFLATHTGKK